MAIKRTYTVTPIKFGKGVRVNYTIEGFSPGTEKTEHRDFSSEASAKNFVEQLKKGGWTAY